MEVSLLVFQCCDNITTLITREATSSQGKQSCIRPLNPFYKFKHSLSRSHPAQHGEGFDTPPTIKRSGSEHRRAVTSPLPEEEGLGEKVELSLQERRRGRKNFFKAKEGRGDLKTCMIMANDNNIQPMADDSQIVLYQPDESISLQVKIDGSFKTVWLSLDQMSELFGRDRSVIGKHVRTIFKEGELQKESVWAKFAYTASDGKTYQVDYYNLDVIISVGYRVKSVQGTKFRIWATSILRQYLLQGYSVNRHLIALQENMDKRMTHIEDVQAKQQQQLDFFIRTSTPPAEMVFFEVDFYTARVAIPQ